MDELAKIYNIILEGRTIITREDTKKPRFKRQTCIDKLTKFFNEDDYVRLLVKKKTVLELIELIKLANDNIPNGARRYNGKPLSGRTWVTFNKYNCYLGLTSCTEWFKYA